MLRGTLLCLCLLIGLVLSGGPPVSAAPPDTVPAAPAMNTFQLNAQADAMVASGSATTNYGAGSLGVTANNQSFVWFNLSAIPANATIDAATLQLMPADIVGSGPHNIDVARVLNSWDESTVTWDSKPGVGQQGITIGVGDVQWQSWDVTALVKQWHAGTLDNYGFALLTSTPGVYFDSKETLPAPRLVITASLPQEDDPDQPVPPDKPFSDLGDAPDSTNNHGVNNTAYTAPATFGQFPTVYQNTPAGQPAGPRHANPTIEAFLGDNITREQGADGGADADGVNNILRSPAGAVVDTADNDRADDGWRNRNVPIPDCQRTNLVVKVHRAAAAQLDKMYLNVYFDGNRDGDWEDVGVCTFEGGQQARSYEWIVQNHPVDLTAIPAGSSRFITVTTLLVHNTQPQADHWMRFILSEQKPPVSSVTGLSDGRGFHPTATPKVFNYGETEDIRYRPDPQGEPGTLTLQKAVVVPSTPVEYGDTVTYKIRLKHSGGTQPVQAELRDLLPYPLHVVPQSVDGGVKLVDVNELSPGVSPLNARLDYRRSGPGSRPEQAIRWKGTLAPDAEVELDFDVHVHSLCSPGETTQTITNLVTLHKADGTKIDEKTATFEAACPDFSVNDIEVQQEIVTDEPSGQLNAAQADAANIMFETVRPRWRGTFTNKASAAVALSFKIEVDGQFLPINPSAARATDMIASPCRTLSLQPGETKTVSVWTDMRPLSAQLEKILDDPSKEFVITSRIRYVMHYPQENNGVCAGLDFLDESQLGKHEVQFNWRPFDTGDAPDSTNHPAAAMTAYVGVPANFPTVFDVTTGAPEGPAHARPRPFHLGQRVEIEPDADLGAAPRNIEPPANIADRDRFDDGANPGTWSFSDCNVSTIQVVVAISPAAVSWFAENGGKGYLNGWIDSNRDGDWADNFPCPVAENLPPVALEHIIIDAPIDVVALGAGLHTLTVSTGRVPWPSTQVDQSAWARLTLSERPSNKPLNASGIAYGDGRGYSIPFASGESEDYLWHPKGMGADPSLDMQLHWEPLPVVPVTGSKAAAYRVTLHLQYGNRGTDPASDVQVFIPSDFPVLLKDAEVLSVAYGQCWVFSGVLTTSCRVDEALEGEIRKWIKGEIGGLSFRTLAPRAFGNIVISWKIEEGVVRRTADSSTASSFIKFGRLDGEISSSSPDVDPTNNVAQVETAIPAIIPRFGFASPEGPYKVRNATTSKDTVELRGTAKPGAMVRIFTDGFESGDTAAAQDGTWTFLLKGLSDGLHHVRATYGNSAGTARMGPLFPAGWENSVGGRIQVDTSLPIDPLSLIFFEKGLSGHFPAYPPGTYNFNIGMPPSIFVPGRTYVMQVRATDPANPPAEITYRLRFGGQEGEELILTLWDLDNDGTFQEEFTVPASAQARTAAGTTTAAATGEATLTVFTQGGERAFDGTVATTSTGTVTDISSGQPISGAAVSLLAQVGFSQTLPTDVYFDLWDGNGGAQLNPQSTDSSGSYLFVPPEGSYRLLASKDGYQSYRSGIIDVSDGSAVAQAVTLTPNAASTPDLTVEIGAGGFSPAILTVPPGTTIRWLNTDVSEHALALVTSSRASAASLDSGYLLPGESYILTVSTEGTFNYTDGADPLNAGTVIVDKNAPAVGQSNLYLPAVLR